MSDSSAPCRPAWLSVGSSFKRANASIPQPQPGAETTPLPGAPALPAAISRVVDGSSHSNGAAGAAKADTGHAEKRAGRSRSRERFNTNADDATASGRDHQQDTSRHRNHAKHSTTTAAQHESRLRDSGSRRHHGKSTDRERHRQHRSSRRRHRDSADHGSHSSRSISSSPSRTDARTRSRDETHSSSVHSSGRDRTTDGRETAFSSDDSRPEHRSVADFVTAKASDNTGVPVGGGLPGAEASYVSDVTGDKSVLLFGLYAGDIPAYESRASSYDSYYALGSQSLSHTARRSLRNIRDRYAATRANIVPAQLSAEAAAEARREGGVFHQIAAETRARAAATLKAAELQHTASGRYFGSDFVSQWDAEPPLPMHRSTARLASQQRRHGATVDASSATAELAAAVSPSLATALSEGYARQGIRVTVVDAGMGPSQVSTRQAGGTHGDWGKRDGLGMIPLDPPRSAHGLDSGATGTRGSRAAQAVPQGSIVRVESTGGSSFEGSNGITSTSAEKGVLVSSRRASWESYEGYVERRHTQFSRLVRLFPHDPAVWLAYAQWVRQHPKVDVHQSARVRLAAAAEQTVGLMDRALLSCHHHPTLISVRMSALATLWQDTDFSRLWREWEGLFAASSALCADAVLTLQALNDYVCHAPASSISSVRAEVRSVLARVKRCKRQLEAEREVVVAAHLHRKDSDSELGLHAQRPCYGEQLHRLDAVALDVLTLLAYLEMQAGYTENAVALFQANCEYNGRSPSALSAADPTARLAWFAVFWESHWPRIGSHGTFVQQDSSHQSGVRGANASVVGADAAIAIASASASDAAFERYVSGSGWAGWWEDACAGASTEEMAASGVPLAPPLQRASRFGPSAGEQMRAEQAASSRRHLHEVNSQLYRASVTALGTLHVSSDSTGTVGASSCCGADNAATFGFMSSAAIAAQLRAGAEAPLAPPTNQPNAAIEAAAHSATALRLSAAYTPKQAEAAGSGHTLTADKLTKPTDSTHGPTTMGDDDRFRDDSSSGNSDTEEGADMISMYSALHGYRIYVPRLASEATTDGSMYRRILQSSAAHAEHARARTHRSAHHQHSVTIRLDTGKLADERVPLTAALKTDAAVRASLPGGPLLQSEASVPLLAERTEAGCSDADATEPQPALRMQAQHSWLLSRDPSLSPSFSYVKPFLHEFSPGSAPALFIRFLHVLGLPVLEAGANSSLSLHWLHKFRPFYAADASLGQNTPPPVSNHIRAKSHSDSGAGSQPHTNVKEEGDGSPGSEVYDGTACSISATSMSSGWRQLVLHTLLTCVHEHPQQPIFRETLMQFVAACHGGASVGNTSAAAASVSALARQCLAASTAHSGIRPGVSEWCTAVRAVGAQVDATSVLAAAVDSPVLSANGCLFQLGWALVQGQLSATRNLRDGLNAAAAVVGAATASAQMLDSPTAAASTQLHAPPVPASAPTPPRRVLSSFISRAVEASVHSLQTSLDVWESTTVPTLEHQGLGAASDPPRAAFQWLASSDSGSDCVRGHLGVEFSSRLPGAVPTLVFAVANSAVLAASVAFDEAHIGGGANAVDAFGQVVHKGVTTLLSLVHMIRCSERRAGGHLTAGDWHLTGRLPASTASTVSAPAHGVDESSGFDSGGMEEPILVLPPYSSARRSPLLSFFQADGSGAGGSATRMPALPEFGSDAATAFSFRGHVLGTCEAADNSTSPPTMLTWDAVVRTLGLARGLDTSTELGQTIQFLLGGVQHLLSARLWFIQYMRARSVVPPAMLQQAAQTALTLFPHHAPFYQLYSSQVCGLSGLYDLQSDLLLRRLSQLYVMDVTVHAAVRCHMAAKLHRMGAGVAATTANNAYTGFHPSDSNSASAVESVTGHSSLTSCISGLTALLQGTEAMHDPLIWQWLVRLHLMSCNPHAAYRALLQSLHACAWSWSVWSELLTNMRPFIDDATAEELLDVAVNVRGMRFWGNS